MTDEQGNHSLSDIIETIIFIMAIPIIMLIVCISDAIRGNR